MPDKQATDQKNHQIYLVSDSTGETLKALTRAALAPFSHANATVDLHVFVRTRDELDSILSRLADRPGAVFHTLADDDLRARLDQHCGSLGIRAISVLDPVMAELSKLFGKPDQHRPGMQYQLTDEYFDRITALEFAIAHDDGVLSKRLLNADVILTGVSRTSKTPTSIYLAYRGVKAANVPLVPGQEPDPAFLEAIKAGVPIIGLTASPARLSQIREHRLLSIGAGTSRGTADYAEIDRIRTEVADALLFFERYNIPVIDVTRRSIEETAASIMADLGERRSTHR